MRHLRIIPAVLVLLAAVSFGQLLPNGQLPPGPPPQPGQPARKTNGQDRSKKGDDADNNSASGGTVPAGTGDYSIPVKVTNVMVPTTVLDPDGHGYVNGLTASNFELYDNDKPQKLSADLAQLPLSVVMAVQANSEVEPLLPKIKNAGVLLQGLVTGNAGDAAILAFDHRIQHLQDFTDDAAKLDDAMHKITAGSSGAALVDAVLEADRMLKRHDPNNVRRRVVVLMSRNVDKGSESRLEETVRSMQFDNVIVYCIDISRAYTSLMAKTPYPRPPMPVEGVPGPIAGGAGPINQTSQIQQMDGNALNAIPPAYRSIRDLFKKTPSEAFSYFTGGRVYNFASERALENAITDIGRDLASQYLLSYNPTNKDEPGFHTIRVVVDRPGLKIRTRPGYWWGGTGTARQ